MGRNVIFEDDEVEYLDGLIAHKLGNERNDYDSMASSMAREGVGVNKSRAELFEKQGQYVALLERILSKLRACV
jgi:hypothetical protein